MPAPFAMPRSCYAAQRSCAACGARLLCVPVGGGPPARSPHASFARSGRSRGPPWPCRRPPAPRPGPAGPATASDRACVCACYGPAAALRHRGQAPQAPRRPSCLWCLWRRWCSGRRRARPPARLGVLTSFGAAPRSPARPRRPLGITGASCAEISGYSDECCYKRSQSEVFFAWISAPLLQTSSIRWLFRRKSRFLDAD